MAATNIWQTAVSVGKDVHSMCDNVLDRMKSRRETIIRAGDFSLDLDSRTLSVRGHSVHLTHAEFDVLVYLISNKKRVISSHTRLHTKSDHAGVQTADFFRNLLSLKKKLQEEVPGSHYIQLESWILYEFRAGQ